MQNEKFKQALAAALIRECSNLPQAQEHEFSPEFERKMNRLIRRQKRPYIKLINTVGKRAACIAVCLAAAISVGTFTGEAGRGKFLSFYVDSFTEGSHFTAEPDPDAPTEIEDIYAITYDLSDYEIYFEEYDETERNINYLKEDIMIDFTQKVKKSYNHTLNTEGALIQTIKLENYEAVYFCDNQNYHYLIFDNGDYVIQFISNVGKDALIEIAESVQKVE